ncbi:MAG: glyoxalase family protein, partial [Gemmatimonadales bacterium]|nr:glyoxalase family protein [Gemmatimonadales bacterium]
MGIHHITAIAGEPQRNLDFYAGTLGLRLVKLTVNYDDPSTYHLYYGDDLGRPGSLLTFFPWPHGRRGRQGNGQAGTVSFAIPSASLGFWIERLLSQGTRYTGPARRFEEQVLSFTDPDGLLVELVATPEASEIAPWADGPVAPEHAIRGLHGTTLWEDGDTGTADFLAGDLGFQVAGEEGGLIRFQSSGPGMGHVVNLRRAPGFWGGVDGVGTIHHVAFRAASEQEQLDRRAEIEAR